MIFKTYLKIWYSLNWRVFVYFFGVYFLFVSIFTLSLFYSLNQGTLESYRSFILRLFDLSETGEIPIFSLTRIMREETLNALLTLPLIFIALRRLPSIPFKGFKVIYNSFWKTFLLVGPGNLLIYLFSYLAICGGRHQEDEVLQTVLAIATSLIVIPHAFKREVVNYREGDKI